MPDAKRWPNVAAGDRDEAYQLIEEANQMIDQARTENDPKERQRLIVEARLNNERAARLLERNGAKRR